MNSSNKKLLMVISAILFGQLGISQSLQEVINGDHRSEKIKHATNIGILLKPLNSLESKIP